jgi:hypothetical protein
MTTPVRAPSLRRPAFRPSAQAFGLAVAVACGPSANAGYDPGPAETKATAKTAFERFACGSESKFPRAQVQALVPTVLDDAWLVLGDPEKRECLSRAVLILGTLGAEGEAGRLKALLLEKLVGPVDPNTSLGLGYVPLALAYIATRHAPEPFARSIADELVACSAPGYWSGRLP